MTKCNRCIDPFELWEWKKLDDRWQLCNPYNGNPHQCAHNVKPEITGDSPSRSVPKRPWVDYHRMQVIPANVKDRNGYYCSNGHLITTSWDVVKNAKKCLVCDVPTSVVIADFSNEILVE